MFLCFQAQSVLGCAHMDMREALHNASGSWCSSSTSRHGHACPQAQRLSKRPPATEYQQHTGQMSEDLVAAVQSMGLHDGGSGDSGAESHPAAAPDVSGIPAEAQNGGHDDGSHLESGAEAEGG